MQLICGARVQGVGHIWQVCRSVLSMIFVSWSLEEFIVHQRFVMVLFVLDRGTKSLHEPNDPAFETVLERVVTVNVSPCGFCPR